MTAPEVMKAPPVAMMSAEASFKYFAFASVHLIVALRQVLHAPAMSQFT